MFTDDDDGMDARHNPRPPQPLTVQFAHAIARLQRGRGSAPLSTGRLLQVIEQELVAGIERAALQSVQGDGLQGSGYSADVELLAKLARVINGES